MKKFILILISIMVIAFVLCGCNSNVNQALQIPWELQNDFNILKSAEFFADGAAGENSIPIYTKSFIKLYDAPNAKYIFIRLADEANAQGKLYALCALYYLDRAQYSRRINQYSYSYGHVTCMWGCIKTYKKKNQVKEFLHPEDLTHYIQLLKDQGLV